MLLTTAPLVDTNTVGSSEHVYKSTRVACVGPVLHLSIFLQRHLLLFELLHLCAIRSHCSL